MPDGLTSQMPRTTDRARRRKVDGSLIAIGSDRGQLATCDLADRNKAESCRRERSMVCSTRLNTKLNC